jgi:hypothetical protein
MEKTKKQKKRKQNNTKRRKKQMYVVPSSTSLDIQDLSNRIAREIPPEVAFENPLFTGVNPRKPPYSGFGPTFSKGWVEENGGLRGLCPCGEQNFVPFFQKGDLGSGYSYRPTINVDLVPLKSIPRKPLLDCNIKEAFQLRAPLQIGIPGYIYGKYCHYYNSPEAKRFLLKNLSANKHVNPANIVPPIQSQGNCWFNAMFVMFFVSDKGRKFFHFFRQLMIEGRQRDGSVIPENIRNAFALLNFGVDACLTGNKFAYEFDTNSIIYQLFNSIPKKYRTDYVVDVTQASNPILYYTSIINYLNQRPPALSNFAPPFIPKGKQKKVDSLQILVLRKIKANWKEQALRYIRSSAHLPHIIVLEIFDDDAATFNRKPVSFQIDNSLYKIDSAAIRDTTKQHFCSTITCETREMAYDGMSFHRLVPLVWKDKLNTDSNWRFAGTGEKLVWNFTKCYQMLMYYRST